MRASFIGLIFAAWILEGVATCFAIGQVEPATLSYQGTLTDTSGQAITGTKTLQVCLYDNPVTTPGPSPGGTAFWCDTYTAAVKNGLFSLVLGRDGNELKPVFNKLNGTTYVGVKLGSDTEMVPRQKLTSVAYAVKAAIADYAYNGVPVGAVNAFAGNGDPSGWLICDGRSLMKTDYPNLYAVIGSSHGSVDNDHFNIPDYRGRFLRGRDAGAGRDPDKASRSASASGATNARKSGSALESRN